MLLLPFSAYSLCRLSCFHLFGRSMSPHLGTFKSLFSLYSTVRPQNGELKLLQLPDFSSSTSTSHISSYHQGHLRLVPSATHCEQTLLSADCRLSSQHGCDGIKNKERKRRSRKKKQKAKEEGTCAPSNQELSIRKEKLYQSGDPLGRKELGRQVVHWIKQGMYLMASKLASSDGGLSLESDGHMGFVMQAQPYLSATPMPKGQESLCFKASMHYPTLFDNFQRELRDVLLQQQNEGLVTEWRSTQSWLLLKELAKSAEHRVAARSYRDPVMHTTLGISLEKPRLMQKKIDDFVKKMTELLHLERDAELEFTKAGLNATSVIDAKSEKPAQPVEYFANHGQALQQCDTICNLKVISSSTAQL